MICISVACGTVSLYICIHVHSYLVTLKANFQDIWTHSSIKVQKAYVLKILIILESGALDHLDKTDSGFFFDEPFYQWRLPFGLHSWVLTFCLITLGSFQKWDLNLCLHSAKRSLHWINFKVLFKAVAMSDLSPVVYHRLYLERDFGCTECPLQEDNKAHRWKRKQNVLWLLCQHVYITASCPAMILFMK